MEMTEYKLVKYRDAGMNTYTYFWTDFRGRIASPYYESEADAMKWKRDEWDDWKANKDIV